MNAFTVPYSSYIKLNDEIYEYSWFSFNNSTSTSLTSQDGTPTSYLRSFVTYRHIYARFLESMSDGKPGLTSALDLMSNVNEGEFLAGVMSGGIPALYSSVGSHLDFGGTLFESLLPTFDAGEMFLFWKIPSRGFDDEQSCLIMNAAYTTCPTSMTTTCRDQVSIVFAMACSASKLRAASKLTSFEILIAKMRIFDITRRKCIINTVRPEILYNQAKNDRDTFTPVV